MMARMGLFHSAFAAVMGMALGMIGWCRADEPWQVREFISKGTFLIVNADSGSWAKFCQAANREAETGTQLE
jgi:hypothetical protein